MLALLAAGPGQPGFLDLLQGTLRPTIALIIGLPLLGCLFPGNLFAGRAPAGPWIGTLGVGAAFLAGHYGLFGHVPPLWPREANHALFHAVLGTALAACFDDPRRRGFARFLLRASLSALAPLVYLKNLVARWELAEILHHVGPLALATLLLWYGMDSLARRRRGASLALVLWLAATGASVALLLSSFAINAELLGTLAAILGAAVVASAVNPNATLEGGALGVVAVTLVLLTAGGVHLASPGLPPAAGLALILAPLAVWPAELWAGNAAPRRAALLRLRADDHSPAHKSDHHAKQQPTVVLSSHRHLHRRTGSMWVTRSPYLLALVAGAYRGDAEEGPVAYGIATCTPTRAARGNPVVRIGVRPTSYSLSNRFSTATNTCTCRLRLRPA